MQTTTFLKISIIALLLINLATLTFMWTSHAGAPPPHERPDGGPAAFLEQALKLDDAQREQYRHMRNRHHEEMMSLRRKAAGFRRDMNELLKTAATDTLVVERYADSIASCQHQAAIISYYHFRELRGICRPDQRSRFDQVIQEGAAMVARDHAQ